ncbi:MAG: hypothetical protein ABFD77_05325 [Thermotogota bacterium]
MPFLKILPSPIDVLSPITELLSIITFSPILTSFLIAVVVLVLVVLLVPPILGGRVSSDKLEKVFEYRSTVLGVILTAFGAWIGAGAAYFFGRENLKMATEKMMKMREPSAQERLRRTVVRDIPPRPLDWRPHPENTLAEIYDRLTQCPDYWFIPIFSKQNDLITVLNEEAFWRYVSGYESSGSSALGAGQEKNLRVRSAAEMPDLETTTVGVFLAEIGGEELKTKIVEKPVHPLSKECADRYKRFLGIYVSCTLEESAADVYRRMAHWRPGEEARLAIVFGENGKPTHFFTTEEVRRLLIDIE